MITIGTDPEFFLADADGNVLSAAGKIGGTKGAPIDLGNGYGLQEDNVMVEYNILPSDSAYGFSERVVAGWRLALAHARQFMGPEVRTLQTAAVLVPGSQLTHPGALTFGCSPDYVAGERGAAAPRISATALDRPEGALRFAGGHVHIGWDGENVECPEFVAAAFGDVFLGLPSIVDGDVQGERRALYGSPGRYRPTSYGIEYRVLSNYWIWEENSAFRVGQRAMSLGYFLSGDQDAVRRAYREAPWRDVEHAIATEDAGLAAALMTYFEQEGVTIS